MAIRSALTHLAGAVSLGACLIAAAAQAAAPSVAELLADLRTRGIQILYSSDLVTPQMRVTAPLHGADPLARAREALAQYGLTLRDVGSHSYLVTRAPPAAAAPPPPVPVVSPPGAPALDEISVYASRYTFGSGATAEPQVLPNSYIEQVPGGHDDAMRAVRLLPGVVSNGSARPYIRGSSLDDVLVQFDGVALAAPYHLKDFQSPVSAFDNAIIDRVDIYSGGYPVRYGTRSGGVIDITPPSVSSGSELSIGASLLSYGVSSVGHAQKWPVDWLVSVRHSSDDVGLRPVNGQIGEPRFTDTLGRLRWYTAVGTWTFGWLLLDDRAAYSIKSGDEMAAARYRDDYGWFAYESDLGEQLHSRTVVALTDRERQRGGSLLIGDFGAGTLHEGSRSARVELRSDWSWQPLPRFALDYGIEATEADAHLQYARSERFNAAVAAAFARPADNSLASQIVPEAQTYALWSDIRRRWERLEVELGLRLDEQHFADFAARGELSPRLNLRYDVGPGWRVYGSWGHFTQAQRVEEWRVETPQLTPDAPELAVQTVLGLAYQPSPLTRLGVEVYRKHWSHVSPYFDNSLERLSLLPDLVPDRMLLIPTASLADGVELSARRTLSQHLQGWASYAWSHVADRFANRSVPRSWDQPQAWEGGLSWTEGRGSAAAVFGWHSGWPRTPFTFVPATEAAPPVLTLGARNANRWSDYFTADLRAGWDVPLKRSDLSTWIALTNTTGRHNACCVQFLAPQSGGGAAVTQQNSWFPRVLSLGFTWRVSTRP